MAEKEEKYWLERLKEGDEAALKKIFDAYYPDLVARIFRIIPDPDACQDIAQDVIVELWNRRDSLEIHSSLGGYLNKAAVNRALNFIKSRNRNVIDASAELPDSADVSDINMVSAEHTEELESRLHDAIGKLPERCRAVFALSRFEDLSHKEIAERLGISVKTIENQITKAMKLLRESLRDTT
ncbi:MAG: RNA polymerase sigma-70 factor [Bacteroidota bacterium]